jgi:hypothetical protein
MEAAGFSETLVTMFTVYVLEFRIFNCNLYNIWTGISVMWIHNTRIYVVNVNIGRTPNKMLVYCWPPSSEVAINVAHLMPLAPAEEQQVNESTSRILHGLKDWGIGIRFPAGARHFSLLHSVQTGSGAHPDSSPMCTGGASPRGKVAVAWSWLLASI